MTNGAISRHRAGGKGFWVIGLLKVIEAVKNIILNAQLPPAQQLTGRCWHASLEYLCGIAAAKCWRKGRLRLLLGSSVCGLAEGHRRAPRR